ncbi:MAG: hypothetical protein IPK58_11955 [Acidobacteria bacterium]|nr:hypothetical protein [Acidobacteriota bacterium]
MKSSAVGTVMFMNHSTNVPEDVFGTVAEATVEKKTADLVGGGSGEVYCLEYLVEVQTDNERAVKTWQMIGSGTKLGASVTVLVRDKSPNPKRSKGIIIEEVEYIETSIVGVPCNRQSWVTAAQKALRLAEKRASRAVLEFNTEEEEVMSKENAGAEPREKTAVAFPLTVAAMEKGRTIRDALANGEAVTLEPVVVKGMFNDILAQEPTLWELYDILWEVRWQLSYQVWNLQALGQTDFTEILALWAEALDEFKAAAITSFMFWNDIANAELEIETDDEMLSNALELEKSLKAVAGAIESATDGDARKHLRAAGERIIELAKSIDILPEDSAAAAPQIPEADQTANRWLPKNIRRAASSRPVMIRRDGFRPWRTRSGLSSLRSGSAQTRFRRN